MAKFLCDLGHLQLNKNVSSSEQLEEARALALSISVKPEGELGRALDHLKRAQKAFESGNHHLLFRGELLQEIPASMRRWLVEHKLLSE